MKINQNALNQLNERKVDYIKSQNNIAKALAKLQEIWQPIHPFGFVSRKIRGTEKATSTKVA